MTRTRLTGMLVLACVVGICVVLSGTACNILFPQCRTDADCAGAGEECVNGQCVAAAQPECTSNADCAEGEVCTAGECVAVTPECTTDADCAEGEVCTAGECVAGPACTTDEDCAEGEVCTDGECVLGEEESPYESNLFFDDFTRVHDLHKAAVTDCTVCHHSEPVAAGFAKCSECHSLNEAEANSYKEIAHDQNESGDGCRSCHGNETTEDGAWDCSFCHTALNE